MKNTPRRNVDEKMAQYAGLSLRDIYARKCDELHCKRNSAFYNMLPSKPDFFEVPVAIDISQNFVGPKGLLAVLEVVRCCSGLVSIDLRDQQMTNESITAVCDTLQLHPTVTTLNVGDNPITIDAGRALLDLAKANPRIVEIHVHNTGMRSVMSGAIAVQLRKNAASKKTSAAAPVVATAPIGTVQAVMDQSVVRDALRGFPNSIAPYLFDQSVVEPIAQLCQQYDALFYDTQFPPTNASIQRAESKEYTVRDWKRISSFPGARIAPNAGATSSSNAAPPVALPAASEVDPEFSWVFTSLAAVGEPVGERVCELVTPSAEPSGFGVYTVRFFIDGLWRYVVVDDFIPVRADGTPAFVSPTSDGTYFWPCILLKATAKLHGCYQAIDQSVTNRHAVERRMTCASTMADLSGGVGLSRSLHHEGFDADEWWGTLLELNGQGAALVATTDSDATNPTMQKNNVEAHHAYRILHIRQINGFRLVHLNSPFTAKRWSGEWAAASPLWEQHSDIATALDYNYAAARLQTDFWMPYLKFLQVFSAVHICRVFHTETSRILEGEWNRASAGGPSFEASWHTNPRYKLTPSGMGHFFITLSLPDPRFTASDVDTLAFHVLRSDTYPLRFDNVVAKTNYVITTSVSFEGVFSADGDMWIVPSSYMTGKLGRFFLRVVGSAPFSVSYEPMTRYWLQRTETVLIESSGEYQNGEDNPQFAVQIPADTHPSKLLVQLYTPDTEQLSLALFLCMNAANTKSRLLGPVPEDQVLAKSKFVIGNTVSLETVVAGGDTTFIVLPYVSPEGTTAKLQFRFWCSHPKFELTPLPSWRRKVVECEWQRSGGYQDCAGNPQIELLTPIPNQVFLIRVHAIGATDPSLIFFVADNHGHIGDAMSGRIPDDGVLSKSTYIRHHTAIREFRNGARPRDSYVIVPCLQPPGSRAKCVVTVSSPTEDFQLRLLHAAQDAR
jgi:hypothetical protein